MLNSDVLVLNRSFLAIHVTSVRRAFSLIYQDLARAVDAEYQTFDFDAWQRRANGHGRNGNGNGNGNGHGREGDWIGTARGPIRIPRVIALRSYDRVPRRHVRYSRLNVFARDKYTCQYCGRRPHRSQLNLDHVVPRSLGGRTTWENVVCSCVDCNRRKGGRTPETAGLRLQRAPTRPRWTPLLSLVVSSQRYEEWRPFLSLGETSYRTARAE